MPVKRDSLDPANSTTITLYRKSEILTEMRKYKHLHIHDIKNKRMWYVAGKVKGELEAVVLIALMMRTSKTKPAQFYFDDRINMVFASCEFSGADHNIVKGKFEEVMDKVLGHPSLRYLKKDLGGDPIFLEHEMMSERGPTIVVHPDETLMGPEFKPLKKAFIPDSTGAFRFMQHFPFGDGNLAFDVHDPEVE